MYSACFQYRSTGNVLCSVDMYCLITKGYSLHVNASSRNICADQEANVTSLECLQVVLPLLRPPVSMETDTGVLIDHPSPCNNLHCRSKVMATNQERR